MIYLHKILPILLSPLFLVLLGLVVALLTHRRAWVWAATSILLLSSSPFLANALFNAVEQNEEVLLPEEPSPSDAIVVLSAGMQWIKVKDRYVAEWATPSRFLGGIALFKAQKAPVLVFTGGKLPWQLGEETEGDVLKQHAEWMQVPAERILVTGKVENTEQEATAVKVQLGSDKKRIILVTSAFHMKRATRVFEHQGFIVTPYPVDLRVPADRITLESFLPKASALNTTHTALRELLGRLYYLIKY
jgi:uncharacterized SAM-binding protein YcdF (DUF218 family)